jgi:hypothetical protein
LSDADVVLFLVVALAVAVLVAARNDRYVPQLWTASLVLGAATLVGLGAAVVFGNLGLLYLAALLLVSFFVTSVVFAVGAYRARRS